MNASIGFAVLLAGFSRRGMGSLTGVVNDQCGS